MNNQNSLDVRRAAAVLLILGSLACAAGAWMYTIDHGGLERGFTFHIWERGLFIASVIFTAIGFVLLAELFQDQKGGALVRIGSASYFFAGVLLVTGESLAISQGLDTATILIEAYVIMAYLAQACIGGALLQSRITAPWIGWATIIWNLGWLAALIIFGWVVGYIPLLHHLMPLVIGIALLRRSSITKENTSFVIEEGIE